MGYETDAASIDMQGVLMHFAALFGHLTKAVAGFQVSFAETRAVIDSRDRALGDLAAVDPSAAAGARFGHIDCGVPVVHKSVDKSEIRLDCYMVLETVRLRALVSAALGRAAYRKMHEPEADLTEVVGINVADAPWNGWDERPPDLIDRDISAQPLVSHAPPRLLAIV
jgi:hypothetical protein